ncbi:MAG TPA: hypothetical protein VGE14_06005 [Marmoricola sp.]
MSTTVLLEVTPRAPVDPDTYPEGELPHDIADLLTAAGQRTAHGFSRSGSGPWRWRFHLSGPDRAQAGQSLVEELRRLGWDADLWVAR